MNTEEKTKIFLAKWEDLLASIAKSKEKFKDKNSIYVGVFYVTRAEFSYKDNKYCLVCYNESSHNLNDNVKGNRVVILRDELLNYYLKGWDKTEELNSLSKNFNESAKLKNNIKVFNDYSGAANNEFLNTYQDIWRCAREINRLKNERLCVENILKYLNLPE